MVLIPPVFPSLPPHGIHRVPELPLPQKNHLLLEQGSSGGFVEIPAWRIQQWELILRGWKGVTCPELGIII